MSATRSWRRWALVALVAVAACGSTVDTGNEPALDDLRGRVAEIRTLASTRQADQVAAKVAELVGVVDDLRARGEMSADAAEEITLAADAVLGRLALITTTTTSTPTTAATVADDPAPVVEGKGRDKGKGEGKSHGKDD